MRWTCVAVADRDPPLLSVCADRSCRRSGSLWGLL